MFGGASRKRRAPKEKVPKKLNYTQKYAKGRTKARTDHVFLEYETREGFWIITDLTVEATQLLRGVMFVRTKLEDGEICYNVFDEKSSNQLEKKTKLEDGKICSNVFDEKSSNQLGKKISLVSTVDLRMAYKIEGEDILIQPSKIIIERKFW